MLIGIVGLVLISVSIIAYKLREQYVATTEAEERDSSEGASTPIKAVIKKKRAVKFPSMGTLILAAGLVMIAVEINGCRTGQQNFERRVAAEVAQRAASMDTTFYTKVGTKIYPVSIKLGQCITIQRQDSVPFVEHFEGGLTLYVPQHIVPGVTQTKLLDARGHVVAVYTADEDGHYEWPGHIIGLSVIDTTATFEIRIHESTHPAFM